MPNLSSFTPQKTWLDKYRFWIYLISAMLILQLPIISIPFKWLESYFHEISHGIAALLTGGTIIKIQLFPNGAGLCTTQGGSRFIISFMGYAGAILWGTMIYLLASFHQRVAQLFSVLLVILFLFSIIFWVRDILSFIIIVVLLFLVAMQFKLPNVKYLQAMIKIIGLMVLINALFSPLYLIDGRALGDGAALAKLTSIPEILWVFIWSSLALISLVFLAKKTK